MSDLPTAKVGIQFDLEKVDYAAIDAHLLPLREKWKSGRVYDFPNYALEKAARPFRLAD